MTKGILAALVVVAFMLVVLAIETWRGAGRGHPGTKDRAASCLILIVACFVVLLALAFGRVAHAHDSGQWENADPVVREWYRALNQPDAPAASCCGEADAYWCDDYFARGGKAYCRITDDRPDAPLGRPHVDVGTEIEIPDHKLKWDRANPTGHAIVFLSRSGYVFCFVQGNGI